MLCHWRIWYLQEFKEMRRSLAAKVAAFSYAETPHQLYEESTIVPINDKRKPGHHNTQFNNQFHNKKPCHKSMQSIHSHNNNTWHPKLR